ncbi:hypothetical protein FHG87_003463 [Trinorchestia longiramus]|nr:hypothetical protein FHG87_003463 [Trinorchestia longiramus]
MSLLVLMVCQVHSSYQDVLKNNGEERCFFQHRVKNGQEKLRVLSHQDNAPAHRKNATLQFLCDNNFDGISHDLYPPNLASRDFWQFPTMKNTLRGHTSTSCATIVLAIFQLSNQTPTEVFAAAMESKCRRCEKCVRLLGDHVETQVLQFLYVQSFVFSNRQEVMGRTQREREREREREKDGDTLSILYVDCSYDLSQLLTFEERLSF